MSPCCLPLINILQPGNTLSLKRKENFELLKATVERKREGGRGVKEEKGGKSKEHDTHSTQGAFSHRTSCILHEVLTEQRAHSPFPLAVSGWQSAQARMNKLFRPFSLSFFLFPSFCLSGLWHCSRGLEVTVMEMGGWRGRQAAWAAATASARAELGRPAGCAGEAGCLLSAHCSRAVHYSGPCV